MADFKCIPVLIDAATGKQIDEFGAIARNNDYFRLLFDETVVLCCQFYDVSWIDGSAQLSEHPIDSALTLSAFGDNDFDPLTSFMFLSEQTEDADNKVNIEGDWFDGTTADPANGQLSFRVDTNTVRFAAVLESSSGLQNFYFCISGVPSGQTAKSVLAYFRFKAENRPSSSVGAPTSSDPEYLNAQEVQALVKSAPVFEYSIDGATLWHTPQVADDRYYREQRNGGEWTEAIQLLEGPQGIHGDNGTGVSPQGTYAAGTSYALNEGVTYGGSYYRSLASGNTGNQPDTSSTEWEQMIAKGDTGPSVKRIIKSSSALSTGTVELDAYIDIYTRTVAADTTFVFATSGLTLLDGDVVTFELHIDMTTVSALTFPASVSWIDTPLFNAAKKYILVFRSTDGGANWLGSLAYEVV